VLLVDVGDQVMFVEREQRVRGVRTMEQVCLSATLAEKIVRALLNPSTVAYDLLAALACTPSGKLWLSQENVAGPFRAHARPVLIAVCTLCSSFYLLFPHSTAYSLPFLIHEHALSGSPSSCSSFLQVHLCPTVTCCIFGVVCSFFAPCATRYTGWVNKRINDVLTSVSDATNTDRKRKALPPLRTLVAAATALSSIRVSCYKVNSIEDVMLSLADDCSGIRTTIKYVLQTLQATIQSSEEAVAECFGFFAELARSLVGRALLLSDILPGIPNFKEDSVQIFDGRKMYFMLETAVHHWLQPDHGHALISAVVILVEVMTSLPTPNASDSLGSWITAAADWFLMRPGSCGGSKSAHPLERVFQELQVP
jgi:hypothetical protein